MRTFIAITFDDKTKDVIFEYGERFKSYTKAGSFTHKENIHLTVKFIGRSVKKQYRSLKSHGCRRGIGGSFTLEFTDFGTFKTGPEHILWLGMKESEPLLDKKKAGSSSLIEAGIQGDDKPLKPHITLGRRVKLQTDLEEIKKGYQAEFEALPSKELNANGKCRIKVS